MIPFEWYWVVFVLVAAAAQTVRNATQRQIAGTAGTLGATYARFIYGLPFAILFFVVIAWFDGLPPMPGPEFAGWVVLGAAMQVAATVALLAAMQGRSFAVAIALSNTSPVQVAFFGFVMLGEPLTTGLLISVLLVTVGTLALSWPRNGMVWAPRPILLGLASGSFFSVAAVGYRGATTSLDADFFMAASLTLVVTMALQSIGLTLWLRRKAPDDLAAVFRNWRQSLLAGFAGALASQLWFSAYALETVARVRTLAVIEILFAQFVSARIFREGAGVRELLGLALLIVGVIVVLNA